MRRRRAVTLGGILGLAGCLRMQESDDTEESTEEEETQPSPGRSDRYESRADAIAYASEPATEDELELDWSTDELPDGIGYSSSSSGGSSTSGPSNTYYNTSQFSVYPASGDAIEIDAGAEVELRFDDVVRETSVTFTVGDGFDGVEATRIRISFSGDGSISTTEPQFFDRTREETSTTFEGEWTGDTAMFHDVTFGEYAVELIVDGSTVGRTGSRVLGIGYQWRFAQTETEMFITRHAIVSEDVEVTLYVDQSQTSGTHLPADGVFKFDLTDQDVATGTHDWHVEIHESGDRWDRYVYLPIRGTNSGQIQIP